MPNLGTVKISRSGLNLFLDCPRCFWLDIRHKVKRPPGYPYTLSAAVDYLVKKEFDKFRATGELPPVLKKAGVKDAKLYNGREFADWRNNFKGIQYYDEGMNAILYGAIDDIIEFDDGSLAVVDYKSSGSKEITIYDDYKRQMDVYNYILSQSGRQTYPEAFFVFYQVIKEGESGFDNTLKFKEDVRSVIVNPDWVGDAFTRAVEIVRSSAPPVDKPKNGHCDHCHYVQMANQRLISEDLNL